MSHDDELIEEIETDLQNILPQLIVQQIIPVEAAITACQFWLEHDEFKISTSPEDLNRTGRTLAALVDVWIQLARFYREVTAIQPPVLKGKIITGEKNGCQDQEVH